MYSPFELAIIKAQCELDHLFFTRYFFKARQAIKFRVNWHHILICDTLEKVITGEIKNLVINVSPGSSKTETVVINFIARGLAINPRCRFLHLSGSDSLASLNSATARDIIGSDTYQQLWPLKIKDDSNSKKRWNVEIDGQEAGGVYATALGGQVTGFRGGHMTDGFSGAILIDDPIKPEDAYSRLKLDTANRKLLTTVKSRKANPNTPTILVMQRLAENDPTGFIEKGNVEGDWHFLRIPAVIDAAYIATLDPKYQRLIEESEKSEDGRFSYWPYKEPIKSLLQMERGDGVDQTGARISRHVFTGQYQQRPTALGGNIIKGEYFQRYQILPKIKYRRIFADTAQKTKEHNDYSVFEEWGPADDGRIYLIDIIRGKWEGPELKRRAKEFWAKCRGRDDVKFGQLREMVVEDKSSGTDLIQTLKLPPPEGANIPIRALERNKDKYTRVQDVIAYIEAKLVCVPEDSAFTNDFIAECEAFTADGSHDFDDQVDPMVDAVYDMLSTGNKLKIWAQLAEKDPTPKGNTTNAAQTLISKIAHYKRSQTAN
jgi:predicted phage terminase large subunit-like protein